MNFDKRGSLPAPNNRGKVANLANLWEVVSSRQSESINKEKQIRLNRKVPTVPTLNKDFTVSTPLISATPKEKRTAPAEHRGFRRSGSFHLPSFTLGTGLSPLNTKREDIFLEINNLPEEAVAFETEFGLIELAAKLGNWPKRADQFLDLYDVPVAPKKVKLPSPPEALYSAESIINPVLSIDISTPRIDQDVGKLAMRTAANSARSLAALLAQEQPLLAIPHFNSDTVYCWAQFHRQLCFVLKLMAKALFAIHQNKSEVSIDFLSSLPPLADQLVFIVRQASYLKSSTSLTTPIHMILSLWISLLNGLTTLPDSHVHMLVTMIKDHMVSLYTYSIKKKMSEQKKNDAYVFSTEESNELRKKAQTAVQKLYQVFSLETNFNNQTSETMSDFDTVSPPPFPSLMNKVAGLLSWAGTFRYDEFLSAVQILLQSIKRHFSENFEQSSPQRSQKVTQLQTQGKEIVRNLVVLLSKLPPSHNIMDVTFHDLRKTVFQNLVAFLAVISPDSNKNE